MLILICFSTPTPSIFLIAPQHILFPTFCPLNPASTIHIYIWVWGHPLEPRNPSSGHISKKFVLPQQLLTTNNCLIITYTAYAGMLTAWSYAGHYSSWVKYLCQVYILSLFCCCEETPWPKQLLQKEPLNWGLTAVPGVEPIIIMVRSVASGKRTWCWRGSWDFYILICRQQAERMPGLLWAFRDSQVHL